MATLRDNHSLGTFGSYDTGNETAWMAMIFTASASYTATSIDLWIYKTVGQTPETITVSLRATTGAVPNSVPTGIDVASGTINGNNLPAAGSWRKIFLTSSYAIVSGTLYAIVIHSSNGNQAFDWGYGGTYANGNRAASINSGVDWTAYAGDHGFRIYSGDSLADKTYSKKLLSIDNNELWYESSAGTMEELVAANADINTNDPLNATIAFQKLFIANGTNLKIADFVNTKIATADINPGGADGPPDFGAIITGASGASMIVDYITVIDGACTIYGKRTTTITFVSGEAVTGTNASTSPYYGTAGAISFTMTAVAEVAPPHWYDWTVYGADATNYGAMPTRANEVCNFIGCLTLSGDPNYPHQWHMSRQYNPFDWLYAQDDAQSAVSGNDADAGEVGDIIKVNIPYRDDYVVHACANTLWYMTGHPARGGEIIELDLTTGILGDRAFCWDDAGNLYMMCTVGLLRIPPGFGQLTNLTIELWPDFITDLAFNASLHRITLAFDPEDRGIHIFKTTLVDGVSSAWWYDLRTEGLFPDSYSADHGAFSAFYYQAENPTYRKLFVGCNDGYIRYWDRTAENDDSTAIDSYVGFAPLALSKHPRIDGIIKNMDLVTGGGASGGTYQSDSDDVLCSVHVARTAEQIVEKLRSGTTAVFTKTFTAPGYQKGNMDRRSIRGQWGAIVLSNDTVDESWSMERLIVDTKEVGRSL